MAKKERFCSLLQNDGIQWIDRHTGCISKTPEWELQRVLRVLTDHQVSGKWGRLRLKFRQELGKCRKNGVSGPCIASRILIHEEAMWHHSCHLRKRSKGPWPVRWTTEWVSLKVKEQRRLCLHLVEHKWWKQERRLKKWTLQCLVRDNDLWWNRFGPSFLVTVCRCADEKAN